LQFLLQAASPETFGYTLLRFTKYSGDQIKEDEMGELYSTRGRDEKYKFWLENPKEKDHSEDLGEEGV
jgi:hypothetical protein